MHSFLFQLLILAPPLLLALTFHEFAHGFVASRLGDPTPKLLGRLTLNPLRHLDPIGTMAFFLFKIGWAKPVQVNPRYFRNPRSDMLWVALAGPLVNLLLAVLSALLVKGVVLLAALLPPSPAVQATLLPMTAMLAASVWVNLALCIFNFLPVPPLDGGRILAGLLPERLAVSLQRMESYGFILILLLAVSGLLSKIILPLIDFANNLLLS